jgi:hypothetical protein
MKIIIWGHKLHSHTHSYIHAGFYKAFKFLGYDTYWFDNNDDVKTFNFDNCLFITETQVDQNIPISVSSKYVLHNCDPNKYKNLNILNLQVYSNGIENSVGVSGQKINDCIYYDSIKKCLYQPWATDLLPNEIYDYYHTADNKTAVWIGSIWNGYHGNVSEINPFIESLSLTNYKFLTYYSGKTSFDENKFIVQSNELAPSIVGRWQKVNGYLPCRIFKNISYGKLGMTNSKTVYELLENNVLYSEDTSNLLSLYLGTDDTTKRNMFKNSLKLVKENHTYINRINTILQII